MAVVGGSSPPRRMSYWDYIKAAFNYRLKIPGLGGVPINWLYVGLMGVASIVAFPAALLLGAAGEIGYLAALSNNVRFQRAVRAGKRQERGQIAETELEAIVLGLSSDGQHKYDTFRQRCEEILQIARRMGRINEMALETYSFYLAELREVYARMIGLLDIFARYLKDWQKTDPTPKITAVEEQLEKDGLSDSVRRSRESTLEILRKRAESRKGIADRAATIRSEIGRLEQQVALLRDQALLTRDPTVLSDNMDAAAGILEEHTTWIQETATMFQGLDEMTIAE